MHVVMRSAGGRPLVSLGQAKRIELDRRAERLGVEYAQRLRAEAGRTGADKYVAREMWARYRRFLGVA